MMTTTDEAPRRADGRPSTWDPEWALAKLAERDENGKPVWTNASLAELAGVSKQAFGQRLKRYTKGAYQGGTVAQTRLLPWTVSERHDSTYITRTLRIIARRDRGDELTSEENRAADRFLDGLAKMGDMVVYYSADKHDGYTFRPRRPEDGTALCVTEL